MDVKIFQKRRETLMSHMGGGVAILPTGIGHIELMQPTEPDKAVGKFLAKKGVEVILGANRDPRFGPLMMFGLGGTFVEVLKDVSFRLAPMWKSSAERMIRQIKATATGVQPAYPSAGRQRRTRFLVALIVLDTA